MIGRTILHYRIVRMLGSGGMGVVYEAEDLKLNRLVALKFLPQELAGSPMALERLQREARAASTLNHPNIATVYAIEQAQTEEGQCLFIAMERLEGQPLDRLIGGQPLAADVALEIGVQVADALDAAHSRGIIHRDIKPANIFVQPRHRVKVLDFGLAKTAAAKVGMTETMEAERAAVLTSPGTTLGTVAYMSPEQARGEELDARTDLFSFGAVLYEMCAGHAPFGGRTSAIIFQKILDKDPESLSTANPSLPPRLEEIVAKALEKDRDLRCQTAAELRADLKRLQRDTTSGRGTMPAASGREPVAAGPPARSSGAALIAEARRHTLGLGVGAVVLIALLIAAGFGVVHIVTGNDPVITPARSLKIAPLTTSGDIAGCTSISPDGRLVVYCDRDRTTGAETLRIRQVASGATIKLADGGPLTTFSPDGNFVYLSLANSEYPDGVLFVLPSLGGEEPRRVLTGNRGPVAVSPDGSEIAFVRGPFIKQSIVIARRDGSAERTLLTVTNPTRSVGGAMSWSPDGRVIAAAYRSTPGGLMSVAVVDVDKRSLRRVTDERWRAVNRVAWLHDGKGVVFSAALPGETNNQLWLLSYPGGQVQRITNDLHQYAANSFGVSNDDTIAIAQYVDAGDLWISDPTGGNPTRVGGGTDFDTVIGWTRDGRVVYLSAAPVRSLWAVSPEGGAPRKLPVDLTDIGSISMAPGQDWLVYTTAGTTSNLGRVDLDGGNRRQLTQSGQDGGQRVTPDGAWVVYAHWESATPSIWKVPSAGGSPVPLSKRSGRPILAPDNQRYCAVMLAEEPQDQDDPRRGIGIFRLSDGVQESTIKVSGTGSQQVLAGTQLQWAADGRALVHIRTEGNVGNLWSLPLDGGAPSQLTRFDSDRLFSFAFSPDGKRLATSRGRNSGDLVLIRNFR
jgi:eukaryotic-like serine/threonine-protein kinase